MMRNDARRKAQIAFTHEQYPVLGLERDDGPFVLSLLPLPLLGLLRLLLLRRRRPVTRLARGGAAARPQFQQGLWLGPLRLLLDPAPVRHGGG